SICDTATSLNRGLVGRLRTTSSFGPGRPGGVASVPGYLDPGSLSGIDFVIQIAIVLDDPLDVFDIRL
ncbi:MAG TPA: hypothetical protein PKE55_05660, partial [Kiritimatiellia bacterium]|nr:hypothetical protein [Kiritimatiellia bacterium]